MTGVRDGDKTTKSLNVATPDHQPVDEIETHAFSLGWNTDMAHWLVMWATAFLPVLTSPQFQTVLGWSLLGIAVTVKQRFMQNIYISLTQVGSSTWTSASS